MLRKTSFAVAAIATILSSNPALADVKAGVDAWSRGDYAMAIKEWRGPAIAGDADAQFNMGQAYKLGRGVPIDLKLAQEWYAKAAAQGHVQAEDNYGLILFQNGDRQRALPLIERSANRGEPRAQYVYATSLFNGDLVGKDWPRAYAFMTRASASGLSPASASLAQMDKFIPLDQRQRGLVIARELESRAARPQSAMSDLPPARPAPLPQQPMIEDRPEPAPSPRVSSPPPQQSARAEPSWRTGAPSALSRPSDRRGRPLPPPPPVEPEVAPMPDELPPPPSAENYPQPTDLPPVADYPGASYPEPGASYPVEPPRAAPAPRPAPAVKRPAPAPVQSVSGGYRVQLGAFSDQARAKALWSSLSRNVAGLRGKQPYLVKAGSITRLQAGPLPSKAAAEKLCGEVRSAAQSCLAISN